MSDNAPLPDASLDQLFRNARSFNGWLDKDVSEVEIAAIYDLMKMGPTAANSHPGRFVWCKSNEAKQKLADCAAEANKAKVLTAPVCVIVGIDNDFHEELPWLFPHADAKSWFDGKDAWRAENAMRNATLQGAYLMMAARSLGLDCGPMSGFDEDAVNKAFFGDKPSVKANFISSIGHGDPASLFDRSPRPDFGAFNTVL